MRQVRSRPPCVARVVGLALATLSCMLAACTPGTPELPEGSPLALSLSLRPKSSCDLTPVQYTTECLAAVEVVVTPERGDAQRTCVRLDGAKRFATLADLLTAEEPVVRFATLSGRGRAVFQVRGIHDVRLEDTDPCAASSQQWLFWGESLPVDLDAIEDDTLALDVVIGLDCRDCPGGCSGLDTPQCPRLMPPAYCVPFASGYSCERRCDDDAECFEEAISCDPTSGRCDPEGGTPEGDTGRFCWPCQDSGDCEVGYSCVGAPNASEGLCARDCPLNRCMSGASCRRLGTNLVLFSGGDTTSVDDGPP